LISEQLQLIKIQKYFIKENAPLVIANGNKTYLYASALNVNNIQSINVFKGEKAINLFGEKAKNGV
jgi:hypothetical protein